MISQTIAENSPTFPPRQVEPLTEAQAATRLGLKVATLRAWRHQHRGPVFVRLGRAIRYLAADIEEFIAANRQAPEIANGK